MADKKDKDADKKKDDKPEGEKPEGEAAEGEGGEGLEPPKTGLVAKLGKKKLILIGVALLLILAGGGGAAYYFMGHKKPAEGEAAAGDAAKAEAAKERKHVFYDLGDILVNLAGEGKRPNFLKIKVSLELEDEKDKPTLDQIKPRILDNFQVYLRELRMEDLKGSAGIYRLREELLLRVTEAAHPVRVRDVLFQEMLVQ